MISEEVLKQTWKKIDDLVDWRKITGNAVVGTGLEMADNVIGPAGLNLINDKLMPKVPQDLHDNIERALQAWLNDDYDAILKELPTSLNEKIRIEQMAEDTQQAWIFANFNAAVDVIRFHAHKNSANSQPPAPGSGSDDDD